MQTIVGTRAHDNIIRLINDAENVVVLISPFIEVWPELRRAVAGAVARGVRLTVITREPRGPTESEMAIFHELEAEVLGVPGLHLKAYLSEKQALTGSVNLTRGSIGRSLEFANLYSRTEDRANWNTAFEIWQRTVDDYTRMNEEEPRSIGDLLLQDIRARADACDAAARERHCYCIVCSNTASDDGSEVVCLRCRANAIAEDRAIVGTHCTACNGAYARSSVDRPLCDACFRQERQRQERTTTRWAVQWQAGFIDAWSTNGGPADAAIDPARAWRDATARRWGVLLDEGGWVSAALTSTTTQPLDLWRLAQPPRTTAALAGLVLERVPERQILRCPDHAGFDSSDAMHVRFARHPDRREPTYYVPGDKVAVWDVDLPASGKPTVITSPDWFLSVVLAPRRAFAPCIVLDADKTHLYVELELAGPEVAGANWLDAAENMMRWMLSACHSYSEADVAALLGGASTDRGRAIAASLTADAPLGLGVMKRSGSGKVEQLGHRSDRVVAIRASTTLSETWHLRASISSAKKVPLN